VIVHSRINVEPNSIVAKQWLDDRGITAYIRGKENPNGQATDLYGIDQFTCVPGENCYICPDGKPLKSVGIIRATALTFIIRRRSAVASARKSTESEKDKSFSCLFWQCPRWR